MTTDWSIGRYCTAMLSLALALSFMSCMEDTNMRHLRDAAARGEESYRKYKTADYHTAKAALLDFIRFLDQKRQDAGYSEPGAANIDIMLSYVRLAKLEEKFSGTEKDHYMQQALAKCQQLITPKRDCTEEKVRKLADIIDQVEPK